MKTFSEQTKKNFETNLLDDFVRVTDKWKSAVLDVDKRDELERGVWNSLVVIGVLVNSDKDKYGRLLRDLRKDFANEDDNFPKTLMMMRERMSYSYTETSNKSSI